MKFHSEKESLKKQERRGRNNQLVVRLSEIFSSIEIEEDLPNENANNNNVNNNNNLLEVNPSPIVIHRSVPVNMESTKISSTILSSTKNSNSLTHVTFESANRNEETSRFEYTDMNSYGNGSVHLNENNQFVILDTQFSQRNSLVVANHDVDDDKEEEDNDEDDEVDLTKVTTFNEKSNKTKSISVLTDKTNSLLTHQKNKNNVKQQQQNDLKTTVNRYSYCSEADIEEVIIPESNTAYDDSDDNENSHFASHFSHSNLARPTKEKVMSKKNKSIKDRTRFGSTQSPVVITKTSSYFSKSRKHTVLNEMSDCPTNSYDQTTSSASKNPLSVPPSHSTSREQSSTSTNSSGMMPAANTNVDTNAQPAIRVIELTLDSTSSTSEINTNQIQLIDQTKKVSH